jgi:predicted GH43/DUF377 family glycosyl hydrolase
LTYTGYNKRDAQLCLATSRDLVHWQRRGILVSSRAAKSAPVVAVGQPELDRLRNLPP